MRAAYIFLIAFFSLFSTTFLPAQPGDPGGGGKPVPIGGIEFLLLAGGALGMRKLISRRKTD